MYLLKTFFLYSLVFSFSQGSAALLEEEMTIMEMCTKSAFVGIFLFIFHFAHICGDFDSEDYFGFE